MNKCIGRRIRRWTKRVLVNFSFLFIKSFDDQPLSEVFNFYYKSIDRIICWTSAKDKTFDETIFSTVLEIKQKIGNC